MTPDRIASVRSALLMVDENNTAVCLHRRHKTGDILRITAGVYIEAEAFADLNPRDCQALVFAARLCALSVRHPSYTLSGPAIASLLGLPGTGSLEKLVIYVPSRSCSRLVHFPEIVIDDHMRIPSARVRTCRPSHPVPSIEYLGFRIATPARVLVDCARLLSDKRGFPIACAGLARACQFDRFHQEASRDREDEARRKFHEALDDTPRNARGRRHARWIIDHADPGCESPGEALVLLALLRAGINGLATQAEVRIDGRTYFIDIALPDLKIAIEFDGRIKYGETVDQVHDSIEAEQRRQGSRTRGLESDSGSLVGPETRRRDRRPGSGRHTREGRTLTTELRCFTRVSRAPTRYRHRYRDEPCRDSLLENAFHRILARQAMHPCHTLTLHELHGGAVTLASTSRHGHRKHHCVHGRSVRVGGVRREEWGHGR